MRESQRQITEKACTCALQTAMLVSAGDSGPVGSSNTHVCCSTQVPNSGKRTLELHCLGENAP